MSERTGRYPDHRDYSPDHYCPDCGQECDCGGSGRGCQHYCDPRRVSLTDDAFDVNEETKG